MNVRASLAAMRATLAARRYVGRYYVDRGNPDARRACREWVRIYRDCRRLNVSEVRP